MCGIDAEEKKFPLSFAVVEFENISSCEWFLTKVKNAIGDREDMVVISDRHEGIDKGKMVIIYVSISLCLFSTLLYIFVVLWLF